MNCDTLEIGDRMTIANDSEPGETLVAVPYHQDARFGGCLGRFRERKVVESPECRKGNAVDLEHGSEVGFGVAHHEVLGSINWFVETLPHESQVDVVSEPSGFPRFPGGA
jgi:hypothetical protein